jgi:hypothetical protein
MATSSQPDRRLLVAVDMEGYGRRDNVTQYRSQLAFHQAMTEAADRLGLDRPDWITQQGGDGELAILPPGCPEVEVVAGLAPTLDRVLRSINHDRAPEARVRLRAAIHEGLVHLDGATGFPGEAIVTVCRLVDAPPLKAALRAFPRANVALIVSDRLHQDVVRHYPDVRPDQFRRVLVRLPDKGFEAVAWIFVPGEDLEGFIAGAADRAQPPTAEPKEQADTRLHFSGPVHTTGQTAFGSHNVFYGDPGAPTEGRLP